jgi:hypothetical protein
VNRQTSQDAQLFKSRPIYAANMIGAFWLGTGGYFLLVIFFLWSSFRNDQGFQNDRILYLILLATGILAVLALVPGRLLAVWPYAVVLEPRKGMWLCAPPTKLWIPLDEIVDIDVYSGSYGGGHVIQLSRSHGLVKQVYINSLFFPDDRLLHELRASIDRRDGIVHTS